MATTCKKCFAPLASTERVCHSCGTPVEITKPTTWSGAPVSIAAPQPKPSNTIDSASIPGVTSTADPFATSKTRSASEIGAVAAAMPVPSTEPSESKLPMPETISAAEQAEGDVLQVINPEYQVESSKGSVLPMPPIGSDSSNESAKSFIETPESDKKLADSAAPTLNPVDTNFGLDKDFNAKAPKSDNAPIYALIVTALIAIGLAVALIFVLASNGKKPASEAPIIVESVVEPYPARIGSYTVELPDGFLFTSNGIETIFYDETQTWSVYAQVVDKSLIEIEELNSRISDNFNALGYTSSDFQRQTFGGIEFLTKEVVNGDSAVVVAYTTLDDTHSFAMTAISASKVADYTILENIAKIFPTVKPATSSPVNADETGIDRLYVRNFDEYVPPEPEPENKPAEAETITAPELETVELEQPQDQPQE